MLPVTRHVQVECDLEEAALYYRRRDPALSTRFLAAYDRAVTDVRRAPMQPGGYREMFRRKRIVGFPFSIVYRVREREIFVVVIENLYRQPGYWLDRVKDLPEFQQD